MPQPKTRQNLADAVALLLRDKNRLLEVLVFSFGSAILGVVVPFYIFGFITILAQFGFASIADFPLLLIIAGSGVFILLEEGSVWGIVGLIVCSLLALGIVIYLNWYFPRIGQRPWQKCLASIVRACGGGTLTFGATLNLWSWWILLTIPDNGEQPVSSMAALKIACVVGLFGALLAAFWPAWRKGRSATISK